MQHQMYSSMSQDERRVLREAYVQEQGGLCFYCSSPLKEDVPKEILERKIDWRYFPPNFLNHPVHLQHDHVSGLTEGAVHAYCNAVMWQYEGR
jgi:hypothetical protein